MKKLLCTAAVAGLCAVAAAPAMAQGDQSALELSLGGYFRGYMTYHNQDAEFGVDERHIDILRDTEVHFTGETTLDNGLTVGVHVEAETDMEDGFAVDESYMYASGSWGRVNFGGEDGAAYLLQVAAPSADSNVDGIRQYVQPVNYSGVQALLETELGLAAGDLDGLTFQWDYAQDVSGSNDKVTYLSPVFNGFQAGVSYTPDVNDFAEDSRGLDGVNTDDVADSFGSAWDLAARYEGQFDSFGLTLGGGYSLVDLEEEGVIDEDVKAWNLGAAVTFGGFGVGAAYTETETGLAGIDIEQDILVLGADYTTGPWKLGASYYDNEIDFDGVADELETQRYAGGVTYTYGPGMTFRGSVQYIDHEVDTFDADATTFLLGTQVNF